MARDRDRDRDRDRRRGAKEATRKGKKKVCLFCKEHIVWVDYKDVNLLRRYMSDRGKIRARRVSGNCAQHQRDVAVAIKTARELALLPYTQRTVSDRGGGRGRGRDAYPTGAPPVPGAEAAEEFPSPDGQDDLEAESEPVDDLAAVDEFEVEA